MENISEIEVSLGDEALQTVCVQEEDTCEDSVGIELPGYDDVTEKKVMASIKSTFKDFTFDNGDTVADSLVDMDALAGYMKTSVDDICLAKRAIDRDSMARMAAMAGRFWCMSKVIGKALESGRYGEGAVTKLAVKTGYKPAMIYSIRSVSERLSLTDCWLMGARGCTSTHLRKLAAIPDDSVRASVIRAFLGAVSSTADRPLLEAARKQLTEACNRRDSIAFSEQLSTNPEIDDGSPEVETTEYEHGMETLKSLEKMLKPVVDNDKFVTLRDSMGNVFVGPHEDDAKRKVDDLKAAAENVLGMLRCANTHLVDLFTEVQSLANGLTVEDSE